MHASDTLLDLLTTLVFLFSGIVLSVTLFRWLRRRKWRAGFRHLRRILAIPLRGLSPVARVVTVIAVNIIIIAVLLELGIRYYVGNYGSELERVRYLYSTDDILHKQSFFVGKPYLGFGNNPEFPQHNSLGFRGPEIEQPKPPGVFRIVALGGSTTYGFGVLAWEETYPAQLERILREEYGYTNVEVINAGVQEYTSWESLVNFQFRVLDLDPDLIIYYEATNDITARLVYPDFYDGLNSARGLWQTVPDELGPSALWRFIAINAGWMKDPTTLDSQFVSSDITHCTMWTESQCGDYTTRQMMAQNPPIYYERNLRSMIAIAQANDIRVMLSSWTYYPDETAVTNIYTFPWRRDAVDEHNAIAEEIAAETGAAFYDLHGNLPYNRVYWEGDGYHQSAAGCAAQAQLYAQFLVDSGLLPSPS